MRRANFFAQPREIQGSFEVLFRPYPITSTAKKSSICNGFSLFWRNQKSQFAAPEQFGVDFGKFGKLALKFQMRGDAAASLPALFRRFEQKLSHLSGSQTLHEIEKWAVLESTLATAVLFAACQVVPNIRCPHQIARRLKVREQSGLAPAQAGRGNAFQATCLNHIYS